MDYEFLDSDVTSPLLHSTTLSAVRNIALAMAEQASTPLSEWWKKRNRRAWSCLERRCQDFDIGSGTVGHGFEYVQFLMRRRPETIKFSLETPDFDHPDWQGKSRRDLHSLVALYVKNGILIAARIVVVTETGEMVAVEDYGMTKTGFEDSEELRRFKEGLKRFVRGI